MKILVTGSEGSLMQSVIPRLLEQGHDIIGVDNLCRYGHRRTKDTRYKFEKVDLTERNDVNDLFKLYRPDYVIQAAARIYGVGGFNQYCADILGEDLTLHNNVLRACVQNKVKRVVYISSSMVYETCIQNTRIPVTEEMPNVVEAPKTDYGLSKFVGERMCEAFAKQYGLEYTIWRPFNIITPYETSEGDLGTSHVFADYIKRIIIDKKSELEIIGDGDQIRCFTWIDEIAQAISDYSFSDKSKNEIFNLGNLEPISMRQLAFIIHQTGVLMGALENKPLVFKSTKSFKNDVRVRVPSSTKARLRFGWEAKQKVAESVKICVENALNSKPMVA